MLSGTPGVGAGEPGPPLAPAGGGPARFRSSAKAQGAGRAGLRPHRDVSSRALLVLSVSRPDSQFRAADRPSAEAPPTAGRAGPGPAGRRLAPRAGPATPPRRSRKVCSIGTAHGRRSESALHFKGPGAAWAGLPPPRSHGTKRPLSFTYSGNLLSSYRARTWSWVLGTRGLTDRRADVLRRVESPAGGEEVSPVDIGAGEGTGMCRAERAICARAPGPAM